MEKLTKLRLELSVPKTRYNKFGNFKYRNQEDILDAVKPLLQKYNLGLTISDEMVMLGDRFYVKATVIIMGDGEMPIISTGYAREPLNKKGMDEPQISGTASSYARKYALNALFLLDDVKDADTNEYHEQTKPSFDRGRAIAYINNLMGKLNFTEDQMEVIQKQYPAAKTRADFTAIQKRVEE